MQPHFEYHTTNRDRVCRICGLPIKRKAYALVLANVHVSPKIVDLHFHEKCLLDSLGEAREQRFNELTS